MSQERLLAEIANELAMAVESYCDDIESVHDSPALRESGARRLRAKVDMYWTVHARVHGSNVPTQNTYAVLKEGEVPPWMEHEDDLDGGCWGEGQFGRCVYIMRNPPPKEHS